MPEIAEDGKQRAGPGLQLYQVWAWALESTRYTFICTLTAIPKNQMKK
jgi:hypothetical protein